MRAKIITATITAAILAAPLLAVPASAAPSTPIITPSTDHLLTKQEVAAVANSSKKLRTLSKPEVEQVSSGYTADVQYLGETLGDPFSIQVGYLTAPGTEGVNFPELCKAVASQRKAKVTFDSDYICEMEGKGAKKTYDYATMLNTGEGIYTIAVGSIKRTDKTNIGTLVKVKAGNVASAQDLKLTRLGFGTA